MIPQEEIIQYETAKLAKEKGFSARSGKAYVHRYAEHERPDYDAPLTDEPLSCDIPAPTQSIMQRWLREEHYINVFVVNGIKELSYDWHIFGFWTGEDELLAECDQYCITYEQALEAGLMAALKLIEE